MTFYSLSFKTYRRLYVYKQNVSLGRLDVYMFFDGLW